MTEPTQLSFDKTTEIARLILETLPWRHVMNLEIPPYSSATELTRHVLNRLSLQWNGKINQDFQITTMRDNAELHLVAVLRRTGWLHDSTLLELTRERLHNIAKSAARELARGEWADHVSCPAALAWYQQTLSTTAPQEHAVLKQQITKQLDHGESYEQFLQRGNNLHETFNEEFLAICAGF